MAVKLHRCSWQWVKLDGHPCWRVEKALMETGVEYERVRPALPRKRDDILEGPGQNEYPAIEFEDGSWYRAESKEIAETIRAGKLDEKRGAAELH